VLETFQIVLVPAQESPSAEVAWNAARAASNEPLAFRAWKKLKSDGAIVDEYAGSVLRLDLDRVPLWRGDSVSVRQLADDYASYPYLQRLHDSTVLSKAIQDGASSLMWEQDGFAYADSWDEKDKRYRGLRAGRNLTVTEESTGLIVRPDVALRQFESERPSTTGGPVIPIGDEPRTGVGPTEPTGTEPSAAAKPKRFHGTVELDSERVGRDASQIADEVISHLNSLVDAEVRVTLEIDAKIPTGAPEQVVRTVTENSKSLKFKQQGFETD
jgi:hypothetical protein